MGNKQAKKARKLKKSKDKAIVEQPAEVSESRVPSPPVKTDLKSPLPPAAPVEVEKPKPTTNCKLYFSDKETEKIRQYLHELSSSESADHLSRDDFLARLGFNNASRFVTRFFDIYDPEGTGYLHIESLIQCLSTLSPQAPAKKKLDLSFNLLDMDGKGVLTKEQTTLMLSSVLEDAKVLQIGLVLTPEQVRQIVDDTFADATGTNDGNIDREAYHEMGKKHLKDLLTINSSSLLHRLKKTASASTS